MRLCLTCGQPSAGTRCPACSRARRNAKRAGEAPRSTGRPWMRLRAAVLERDGYTCIGCGARATEVHHIVPVASGGPDHPDNLVSLCHDCHVLASRRAGRKVWP